MLITKEVEIKWHNFTKRWYIDKGYLYTKVGDIFTVKVEDLQKRSEARIEVLCDYCLEEGIETIINRPYKDHTMAIEGSPVKKDCCKKCLPKKNRESNLLVHGVDSTNKLKENREKFKQTCLERYNETSPMKTKEFQEKAKNTNLDRYGVEYLMQNDELKERFKQSMYDKYGVEHALQVPEFKEKAFKTIYKNGTRQCPAQQKYIHQLIGGELNYPVGNCLLDIGFSKDKIYFEYDGSGHDLAVKLNRITQKEFEIKEIRRWYYLKSNDWREIRIISRKDYLPLDETILTIIDCAKQYLDQGHSWIKFDIDNKLISCSQFNTYCDFGELHKVNKLLL